jgi:hypothetical protein
MARDEQEEAYEADLSTFLTEYHSLRDDRPGEQPLFTYTFAEGEGAGDEGDDQGDAAEAEGGYGGGYSDFGGEDEDEDAEWRTDEEE